MTSKFGYSKVEWDTAKEEMRQILIDYAKARIVIHYTELVERIKTIRFEPESYALSHMLEEISRSEDEQGNGILTVIVVHKTGDMLPGPGFFKLAKGLGRNTDDITKCWVEELKKVYAYWSHHTE